MSVRPSQLNWALVQTSCSERWVLSTLSLPRMEIPQPLGYEQSCIYLDDHGDAGKSLAKVEAYLF